ncbi:4428_t:CDS:2 [Funneliformis caledonium]|uniref:4428_t:CDS:1 n=1 Tax=Funneliformis caledonium TaxID=1117310 RepID=A0A9N9I0Y9_9GLOM|nr:4428_t:CDS:2 [Funneliformis caledonium]
MSEDVNSFWLSVDMKKRIDVKKLECAGNALDAIANETRLRSVVTGEVISIVGSSQVHNNDKDQGEASRNVLEKNKDTSANKRKLEDDQSDYCEGLKHLFDESNEDSIIENIDEKSLEEEDKLPPASGNKDPPKIRTDVLNAFRIYQEKIPKIRRVFTPAYWGVLDLTKESLFGCKEITENDIHQLSQDFADHIKWKCEPAPRNFQKYFDGNCDYVDSNHKDLKKFDTYVQFMKVNMHSFQGMLTEEQLKMTTSFPLIHGTFTSNNIKDVWGEVQALSTSDARNENVDPFKKARMGRKVDMKATLTKTLNKFEVIYGEVAGGLGSFGIPSACRKKRFLDKVKLTIIMRDGINRLLKECKHVTDESRRNIIIYGWLQVGLELNFYAMDWQGNGIYRFGLVDRCRIPVDEDDCSNLEDAYCVLKSLESKSLETEKVVKSLLSENTKGKRRRITPETEPELNTNRTPKK